MRTSPPENQDSSTRERGSSLVEYALLVGLITAVCVSALSLLGHRVESDLATGTDDGQTQVMGSSDSKEDVAAQEQAAEDKAAKEKAAEEQAVAEQAAKDAAAKHDGEDGEKKPVPDDEKKPASKDEKKPAAGDGSRISP